MEFSKHIIEKGKDARSALKILDSLPDSQSRTLFVVDAKGFLLGTITDGDIRRGLLAGQEISEDLELFMNKKFKSLETNDVNQLERIKEFRKADIELIPVLDNGRVIKILDLERVRSVIPAAALIMAGGKGERLKPFTESVPKPMLKIGTKPILEHNIDRLIAYGINQIYISVNYLRESIMNYFGDGSAKGVKIFYVEENDPLGTLGALSLLNDLPHSDILVMNSDILTNIDFEDFYLFYKEKNASVAVASIPYTINIPYAVLETADCEINSFKEKPTYTYYSNGGIYFIKASLKNRFKPGEFYNATDLMDVVIRAQEKIVHYPVLGYWLDIGNLQDFSKAQEDIKHIKL